LLHQQRCWSFAARAAAALGAAISNARNPATMRDVGAWHRSCNSPSAVQPHPLASFSLRAHLALCLLTGSLFLGCGQTDETKEANAGQKSGPGDAVRVVRIGYQKIGPPFLLKERSEALVTQLAAHNARPEWIEFAAGPALLEAMRGGAVDIGYVGETPPVFAQAGGVSFVYVATDPPAPRAEAIIVKKDSPIQRVADLRGKRVALNRGSNVHYLLVRALEKEQLSLADIQLLFLAPADARAAFESGEVDAWVIWDPFLAAAEKAGGRILCDGEGLVDNHFFYVARREFAEERTDLVRVLLGEFQTLSGWEREHPEEAARLLASSTGVSYEALLVTEGRHSYGLLPIASEILAKQQTIADTFYRLKVIPREIHVQEAFLAAAAYARSP